MSSKDLPNTEKRLSCERCGQEFGCRSDDIAACWCNAEPYRLPLPPAGAQPSAGGCLCPACLREEAYRLQMQSGSAAPR